MEQTLIHFFSDMYTHSNDFKEICCKPEVIDIIVEILFPIVCGSEEVPVETELYSKDSILTFDTDATDSETNSVIAATVSDEPGNYDEGEPPRSESPLRRGNTFVLVTKTSPHSTKKVPAMVRRYGWHFN